MASSKPIYLVMHGAIADDTPPLGLLYVGQALKDAGFSVRIFHIKGPFTNSFKEAVNDDPPLYVGFSTNISRFLINNIGLSSWLKSKKIPVVWGGIFPTVRPEVILESGVVDYVVRGEGEYAAVSVAEAIENNEPPRNIPGVCYKDGEEIIVCGPAPPEQNIDKFNYGLELVDWDDYIVENKKHNYKTVTLPFSRGCPFTCTFCSNAQEPYRSKWRSHSSEYMKSVVNHFKDKYNVNMFSFMSDNLFGKVSKTQKTIEELNIFWAGSIHLKMMNSDFLDWATEYGGLAFMSGLESGSDRTLQKVNKKNSADEIRTKMKLCAEKDISIISSWIIFVPGETRDDVRKTFSLMDEIYSFSPKHTMSLNLFRSYPGTPLWDECVEMGLYVPKSLDEWAVYEPSVYFSIGLSKKHAKRMRTLAKGLYGQYHCNSNTYPDHLIPYLRRRLDKMSMNLPIEEGFYYKNKIKDIVLRKLLP